MSRGNESDGLVIFQHLWTGSDSDESTYCIRNTTEKSGCINAVAVRARCFDFVFAVTSSGGKLSRGSRNLKGLSLKFVVASTGCKILNFRETGL